MTDPLAELVRAWLRRAAEGIIANSAELTALDARIGDGDHGINMRRGMEAVREVIDSAPDDAGAAHLLRQAGRRIISVVGGASGPLYGTLLVETADALGESPSAVRDLAAALEQGVAAVGRRGRSQAGQKTMLDTLMPAAAGMASALRSGASAGDAGSAGVRAAGMGRDATRDMIAQRGRASYLGERARGHLDPGAVSAFLLIDALGAAMADQPAASASGAVSR